jgi:hypothetical protein
MTPSGLVSEALHPRSHLLGGPPCFVALRVEENHTRDTSFCGVLLLSCARFLIDFTRYYGGSDYLGRLDGLSFNNNQLIAALLAVVSAVAMGVLKTRNRASTAGRRNAG